MTSGLNVTPSGPTTLQNGNPAIYAFAEQQGVTITSNLYADIGTVIGTQTFDSNADLGTFNLRGDTVNSYYLYSNAPNGGTTYNGTITFDSPIVGVIVTGPRLNNSDSVLGLSTVTYTPSSARGLELSQRQDILIDNNNLILNLQFDTHNAVDSIRVITAVPEPGSWAAMAIGFGGLAVLALRRRKTA